MRLARLALAAGLALLLGAASGCGDRRSEQAPEPPQQQAPAQAPEPPLEPPPKPAPARVPVQSNILRADYAGSAVCGDCHEAVYAAWQRSPMHRMTRLDRPGEIRAPFDGATLRL